MDSLREHKSQNSDKRKKTAARREHELRELAIRRIAIHYRGGHSVSRPGDFRLATAGLEGSQRHADEYLFEVA